MTLHARSTVSLPRSGETEHRGRMGVGSVEIRAAASSGGPVITGYAAVFDSPSSDMGFVEVIDPAAFNRTLNVADVRALVNHDPNQLLGRSKSGTLRLSTDATGLRYEIDVNQADQSALDAVAKVRRGDMDGASFSFQTIRDEWNFNVEPPQRRLLEVALVDVGPVSFPAYQAATAQSRSMQAQSMKDRAWELHARSVTRLTGRLDALRLAVPEAFQDAL